jgi:hypothetical protein
MRNNSVCDNGIIGPPHTPCMIRPNTSMPSELANPHTSEKTPNMPMQAVNTRTAPKRAASQPVSGTKIASATAYDVITQVPWLLLIPRLPAMLGTETLATVMSSTAMKFAAASTMAAIHSIGPFNGPSKVAGHLHSPL